MLNVSSKSGQMNIPYLSLGEGHRGNVGILHLIQGAHYFLKDFSIQLLIHNLHLKRTHTAPIGIYCASTGQPETYKVAQF